MPINLLTILPLLLGAFILSLIPFGGGGYLLFLYFTGVEQEILFWLSLVVLIVSGSTMIVSIFLTGGVSLILYGPSVIISLIILILTLTLGQSILIVSVFSALIVISYRNKKKVRQYICSKKDLKVCKK